MGDIMISTVSICFRIGTSIFILDSSGFCCCSACSGLSGFGFSGVGFSGVGFSGVRTNLASEL